MVKPIIALAFLATLFLSSSSSSSAAAASKAAEPPAAAEAASTPATFAAPPRRLRGWSTAAEEGAPAEHQEQRTLQQTQRTRQQTQRTLQQTQRTLQQPADGEVCYAFNEFPEPPTTVSCDDSGNTCNGGAVGCSSEEAACFDAAILQCQQLGGFAITNPNRPDCAWQYACCLFPSSDPTLQQEQQEQQQQQQQQEQQQQQQQQQPPADSEVCYAFNYFPLPPSTVPCASSGAVCNSADGGCWSDQETCIEAADIKCSQDDGFVLTNPNRADCPWQYNCCTYSNPPIHV
jgi:hypothetical protein